MAVNHHLGYYRTGNSAIRSPTPKTLEPDMEWIGCTVCKIFAFKLYCDLETGVRGHSRSSKVAPFDRAHTTLCSSSIVTNYASISYRFRDIAAYWSKIATPLYFAPPLGVTPSDLRNDPWWRKTRMMGLSDGERISMIRSAVLIQYTRVTDRQTDGRTDRQTELAWHIRVIAYIMLPRVKTSTKRTIDPKWGMHNSCIRAVLYAPYRQGQQCNSVMWSPATNSWHAQHASSCRCSNA